MSKRTKITAVYRIGSDEVIQYTISVPTAFPDSIAEAKVTVLAMMREQLTDVMRQTRGVTQEDGSA